MTSFPKDSAGVDFDPATHQAWKDGTPKTTKTGRYFVKGKRPPLNRKGRTNPPLKKAPPGTPEIRPPAPVKPPPKPTPPGELPPLQMSPATEADILGDFAKPTIRPGEPEPAANTPEPAPEGAAPMASEVAADAPAPDVNSTALAGAAVGMLEMTHRAGIDPDEWALKDAERQAGVERIQRALEKHGISPEISPEGEVMLWYASLWMTRMHREKSRTWLGEKIARLKRVLGFSKPEKKPVEIDAASLDAPPS